MWRLYNHKRNEAVHPLHYQSKSQYDVVKEIVDALQEVDTVFLQGAVGTGKSVVALHLIAEFGKGIIQTPTKALESQYQKDYQEGDLCILMDEGTPLNVEQIKGRNNFSCPYFYNRVKCDYKSLPCSRPLRKEESRLEVARECPYWSPVIRKPIAENYAQQLNAAMSEYEAVGGTYGFVHRKENCPYYDQYQGYVKGGAAVIMNSALWDIETFSGRKAAVPIEIIDEGDAYLDGLCFRISVGKEKLDGIFKKYQDMLEDDFREDLTKEFNRLLEDYQGYIGSVGPLVHFLDNLVELQDITRAGELNRLKIISMYAHEAYVVVNKDRMMFYLAEPSFVLKEVRKRSGKLVFMSATFQDLSVLEEVYGLEPGEYKFCFGEERHPGTVYAMRTGSEAAVNFKRWKNGQFREQYFQLRDSIVEKARPPKLVQVWGKKYAKGVEKDFKSINVLEDGEEDWSTVASRGLDLADDKCRSIILLKCPFPDAKDPILQTMKHKLGEKAFWKYYNDIAERNLIQQVGRGVRNENDWVEVWSPDEWVFSKLAKVWRGRIIETPAVV
ncbi:MAG: helicase C-terminal domain-containing protein [Archaeoglobaceae archaeon]